MTTGTAVAVAATTATVTAATITAVTALVAADLAAGSEVAQRRAHLVVEGVLE